MIVYRRLTALLTLAGISVGGLLMAKNFGESDLPTFLQRFDTNNDDQIDEEERQAIRDLRAHLRSQQRDSIDLNQDGLISPDETETARRQIRLHIRERRIQKFLAIAGQDQLISATEYASIPGIERLPDSDIQTIWDHLDTNLNGTISLDEFLGVLRHHE